MAIVVRFAVAHKEITIYVAECLVLGHIDDGQLEDARMPEDLVVGGCQLEFDIEDGVEDQIEAFEATAQRKVWTCIANVLAEHSNFVCLRIVWHVPLAQLNHRVRLTTIVQL